ncbi:MAG: GntR family transcriptional regulator [Shinella sp.]|nr:MAG: GntR family transcriptional regulator [Shinella sp.]
MNENVDTSSLKRTLASSTYEELRKEIIAGKLPSKAKLNIRQLASRFQVGLAPIREALSRLSTEGLVSQSDHRGFAVVSTTVEELWDLHGARVRLNELALRESIEFGDAAWEEQLVVAGHRLLRIKRPKDDVFGADADEWSRQHKAFHHALLAACQSKRILQFCDQLFDELERYRHVGRHVPQTRPDVADEHRAIMQAALDRNADQATSLLKEHYLRTVKRVEIGLTRTSE